MTYVDRFVAAVPTANREIYKKHAEAAAIVFKEHGALKLVECWGDDVPEGKVTSFSMEVKCKDDETVVFSWITWPSRKMRDEGMKKVMADPRLQPDTNPMPFDGTRRSKKYRDRAEECRRLAKMATDDELKASYQALAKSYDTLAKEADDVEQSGLCLSGSVPISIRCLYPFHIRRKRALMSTGSLGGLCPFAGTAGTGHAHP